MAQRDDTPTPIDTADRLELHELPGRYGDAIDDRDWDRLDWIFTADAVFDLTDLGGPRLEGLEAIKTYMDTEAQHPRTHTMTNIYVDVTDDGVELHFRILALMATGGGRNGRLVGTASYRDEVVRTPAGWRVANRVISLRRTRVN